jgi:Flp pilus assembly protein TadB
MKPAVSFWNLIQDDRLVRWAACAGTVVLWFAIAWASLRILLVGVLSIGFSLWWLRRQRRRRGWFEERPVDIDLL